MLTLNSRFGFFIEGDTEMKVFNSLFLLGIALTSFCAHAGQQECIKRQDLTVCVIRNDDNTILVKSEPYRNADYSLYSHISFPADALQHVGIFENIWGQAQIYGHMGTKLWCKKETSKNVWSDSYPCGPE
jgi:hypothetical protein